MESEVTQQLLSELGEVKGMLRGVTDMIRQSNETTHKRIDDLAGSLNQRLDGFDETLRETDRTADRALTLATDTAARMNEMPRRFTIAGSLTGGTAGGAIAVAVALIKYYMGS